MIATPADRFSRSRRAAGFTLIECVATIVILSIVAGATSGILLAASDAYASSSAQREAAEELSLALDRVCRLCREAPEAGASSGEPDITAAEPSRLVMGDGASVELIGSTLWLSTATEAASPLCTGVTSLEMTYLGADGMPLDFTQDALSEVRSIAVRIATAELELGTLVYLRITVSAS